MTDEPGTPADFDFRKFIEAQDPVFESVLDELRSGRKSSHWMWFVFPQLKGLGSSWASRHFAIRSLEEARAYLADPVLGPRYREAVRCILAWAGRRDPAVILGAVDAAKLRSSLTLFANASGDPLFEAALRALFGEPDRVTLRLLGQD